MADARTLTFTIAGDSRKLQTSLASASASVTKAEGHFSRFAETAKHVAEAFAVYEGIRKVVDFFKDSAKAAIEDENALTRVSVAVKNQHEDWGKLKDSIDGSLTKMSTTSGFMKTDLANAFATLERATGSHTKALKLLNDAMNASASTGKPLAGIAVAMGKAFDGSAGALGRLGIILPATDAHLSTTQKATEALKLEHERFAGAVEARSETMAGKMAIFSAQWEDIKVKVGEAIMPLLISVMGDVVKAIDFLGTDKTVQALFQELHDKGQALADWFQTHWPQIKTVIETVFADARTAWETVLKPTLITIGEVIGTVVTTIQAHWDQIKATTEADFGAIASIVRTQIAVIRDIVNAVLDVIHGRWGDAWDAIKKIPGDALANIAATIKGAITILGPAAEAAGKAIWSGFTSALSGLGDAIANMIKAPINALIDRINSTLSFSVSVDTHIPGVGKQSFNYGGPHLPTLATGGLVKARPGGTLAVLGEGGEDEMVVPLSKAPGVLGGNTFVNHFHRSDVSSEEVAQRLSYLIRRSLPVV